MVRYLLFWNEKYSQGIIDKIAEEKSRTENFYDYVGIQIFKEKCNFIKGFYIVRSGRAREVGGGLYSLYGKNYFQASGPGQCIIDFLAHYALH